MLPNCWERLVTMPHDPTVILGLGSVFPNGIQPVLNFFQAGLHDFAGGFPSPTYSAFST